MPNWCHNHCTVVGPHDDIDAAIDFLKPEREQVDFGKLIPEPPKVLEELAAEPSLEELRAGKKMPPQPPEGPLWYRWRNEHWGTKWNGSEWSHDGKYPRRFTFCTAWAPPFPIFEALSKKFLTLLFAWDVADESDNYIVPRQYAFSGGVLVWEHVPDDAERERLYAADEAARAAVS